jgi:hypothetical protein
MHSGFFPDVSKILYLSEGFVFQYHSGTYRYRVPGYSFILYLCLINFLEKVNTSCTIFALRILCTVIHLARVQYIRY